MKTKDHYKNIAEQEKASSDKWNKADRETSPEERIKFMYNRVTNRVKTDEEGL